MNIIQKVNVMLAYSKGKPIEMKYLLSDGSWWPTAAPEWNWGIYIYRVAETKEKYRVSLIRSPHGPGEFRPYAVPEKEWANWKLPWVSEILEYPCPEQN